MKSIKLLMGAMVLCVVTIHAQEIKIIPYPNSVQIQEGVFNLSGSTRIYFDKEFKNEAAFLQRTLKDEHDLTLALVEKKKGNMTNGNIYLLKEDKIKADPEKEKYTLVSDPLQLIIKSESSAGIFYGIQSLRQVIKNKSVPCFIINDAPRFGWRAFLLDEARYFKGEKVVKDLLDEMALLKMNVFHWHLTDDQGWRIEIKKYPKLTEIGSKRKDSEIGTWLSDKYEGKEHSGYYTQAQIKDIIQYAADRHITIIPEIEMPGHASAAMAAYPWLGPENKKIEVPIVFRLQKNVYNVADPKVIGFLHDVLNEVMDLFPSKIIHIGGDEVNYDQWKNSPQVNEYMKKNNIQSYADLQITFTNAISNYLEKKQRRMMGWNEIMRGQSHEEKDSLDAKVKQNLSSNVVIHFWTGGPETVKDAAQKGFDVVNSYAYGTYLDYDYTLINLEHAYSFDPIPSILPEQFHKKILGLGCQMWGEWIPTIEKMNYQVYPRIAAYAEVGWTKTSNKNFVRFKNSLIGSMIPLWEKKGIRILPEQMNSVKNITIEAPKNYYLSATGNNNNDGLTKNTAWQSLNKINEIDFKPGDSILLEGGRIFKGNINLTSYDNGSDELPVVFTSYGKGKAVIDAGEGEGVLAINSSNIKLLSLKFRGDGIEKSKGSGIHFFSNDSISAPSNITINDCDVSGFRTFGIGFGSHENISVKGYNNVRITHTNVSENGEAGIGTYGSGLGFQHRNFYIAYCKAYRNRGILSKPQNHSGNGIVIAKVDGLLIEHCEAFENGMDNRCTAGGPVGIWVWMCKNAIIQYCSSHDNYAGLTKDGGGFDIDGGSSDCIIQYNTSYNNEGAGYLLAEFGALFPFQNNIIRFNVSINDGRKNGYGAITVWGADSAYSVTNTYIYNNTVYVNDKNIINGTAAAITLLGPHFKNVVIANNIFVTNGNVNLISSDTVVKEPGFLLLNNNYYSYTNQYNIQWGNTKFTSLKKWMNNNPVQESMNGHNLYRNIDPLFINKLNFTRQSSFPHGIKFQHNDFKLQTKSGLRNQKWPLKDYFNILSNTVDYCGNYLSEDGLFIPGACVE